MSILIAENKQVVDTETGELLDRFEHRRRNFVWFNYNINELTDKGFNKADIFRIFYLATFIDYSNMLRCDNHKWTKDDIKKELRYRKIQKPRSASAARVRESFGPKVLSPLPSRMPMAYSRLMYLSAKLPLRSLKI